MSLDVRIPSKEKNHHGRLPEVPIMPSPTIAALVGVGVLRRLPWCGQDDAALRTTHSFTLGAQTSRRSR